jgi:hypothetical protein
VQSKSTPLHMAAWYGNSESGQLLLAAKSNIHAENKVSYSVLQIHANMMELCGAELCGVDWCRTNGPRYTRLLGMDTVSQCSYYSLRRAMFMLRTR